MKSDLDTNETLIILKQKKAQLLFASNLEIAIYAKRENYNDQHDKVLEIVYTEQESQAGTG